MGEEQVNNNLSFNTFSVIEHYGEDLTDKTYITNPAIARETELKKLIMVLLTPEKSALLVGKAGIGKTAIVEGLAYLIERDEVPNALKGYRIIKIATTALLGKVQLNGKEELVISLLVKELKETEKTIVFIDEVHTLMGARDSGPMDLANILKPALDRGDVKAIGATTTQEYDTYVIRDRAFLRRFERIDVLEPNEETTINILMGSLPKIEKKTGAHFKYNEYVTRLLVERIVQATSEFKRVYGLAAQYPDVSFSVLQAAFSQALFNNREEVNISDVYEAIKNSKRIYPDSIVKELTRFREDFKEFCDSEGITLEPFSVDDIKGEQEFY